jgi:hypothetical protein
VLNLYNDGDTTGPHPAGGRRSGDIRDPGISEDFAGQA